MAAKKSSTGTQRKRRSGQKLSPAEKASLSEIKQGVKHVEKSISEVQRGLRKAEKAIAADARTRIRELRKEGKAQLVGLRDKRKEAARLMKALSVAAEDSWSEVRAEADRILVDAKASATRIADRIRTALER